MPDLTIIHTNDLHNRLDSTSAQKLKSAKGDADALLLDSGDAVWAGNVYFRPGGEPILETMSLAGYDAMTLGNREFHFTRAGFNSKLSKASFSILCANIRSLNGNLGLCKPFEIFIVSNIKVAVTGVTVPMVKPGTKSASFSAFIFEPPEKTAVDIAKKLRGDCDVLIGLNHVGLKTDMQIAELAPEYDLIIGGHSHDQLEKPIVINGVPIVQTGYYAKYYGVSCLNRNSGKWCLDYRLVQLKASVK